MEYIDSLYLLYYLMHAGLVVALVGAVVHTIKHGI